MATVKLKFRPSTVKGKKGTLYYQVTQKRKVSTVSTPYQIFTDEWDKKNADIIIKGDKERKATLQLFHSKIKWEITQIREIIQRKALNTKEYPLSELLKEIKEIPNCISVYSFIQEQIMKKTEMKCYGTARTYKNTLRILQKFRNQEDLVFNWMDHDMMVHFEVWMLHSGLKRNSASCYLRTLRTLYGMAVEQGLTEDMNIFRHVHTSIGKTGKRAVTAEHICIIGRMDLSDKPSLAFARDVFMFSFYTRGMSFVDIAYLKKSDIKNGILTYNRRKTFQCLHIEWETTMQSIVDQYAEQTKDSPYIFPIVKGNSIEDYRLYERAEQRVNRNLKKIGERIGLTIPLTTYVARHSWASIARSMDIPLSIISEGLGHDSDKTTQVYLASLDTAMVNTANKKIIKLITK